MSIMLSLSFNAVASTKLSDSKIREMNKSLEQVFGLKINSVMTIESISLAKYNNKVTMNSLKTVNLDVSFDGTTVRKLIKVKGLKRYKTELKIQLLNEYCTDTYMRVILEEYEVTLDDKYVDYNNGKQLFRFTINKDDCASVTNQIQQK